MPVKRRGHLTLGGGKRSIAVISVTLWHCYSGDPIKGRMPRHGRSLFARSPWGAFAMGISVRNHHARAFRQGRRPSAGCSPATVPGQLCCGLEGPTGAGTVDSC
jgi:hypothetical protein